MARILIVDDSPTEMYKLTAMLEKHGHQVLKAENGADGVALARQEKPDAVLMDIVMPGLNGFQATRQLTRMPRPATSRWSSSHQGPGNDKVWGKRQGAKDYLTKPLTKTPCCAPWRVSCKAESFVRFSRQRPTGRNL